MAADIGYHFPRVAVWVGEVEGWVGGEAETRWQVRSAREDGACAPWTPTTSVKNRKDYLGVSSICSA